MDAIVFILEHPYLFEAIMKYHTFYKIVIINKKSIADRQQLKSVFDEVIIVNNIHNDNEIDCAMTAILANRKIRAIYGSYESALEIAGRVRSKFGIPGMSEKDTLNVRNKVRMKNIIAQHGIPTAGFKVIKSIQDRFAFINSLRNPVVIKPVDGFATKYTCKIESCRDLFSFQAIRAMTRHKAFLAETFIDGAEYHCDSVVVDGKVMIAAVAKYLNNCLDTINFKKPSGSIFYPSLCDDDDMINKIKSLNKQAVKHLNIQNAVCHMEAFIDKQGNAIFGEITPRIGGSPHMGECINNIYGIDVHEAFVDVEMHNYEPEIQTKSVFTGWISFPSKQGKVIEISREEDFSDVEGVVKVRIYNKVGDKISRRKNTTIRTGYIIIEDVDHKRLLEKLYDAYGRFQLGRQGDGGIVLWERIGEFKQHW